MHLSTTLLILGDLQQKGKLINERSNLKGIYDDLMEILEQATDIEKESLILGEKLTACLLQELEKEQSLLELVSQLREKQTSLLQQISEKVTELQIRSLHEILKSWESLGILDRADARAVVAGTQGPRQGMIEVQYLQHYFKNQSKEDNDLVFYAEMPPQLMSQATGTMMIEYLSKELCNSLIGGLVFNDKKSMQRDILHQYAAPVIKKITENETQNASETRCPFMY
ncbi:protein of unknown function [Legionella hackeliae]|uniref:Uncharacterized protein n=1 Tax=Legionella hackeliae TaxID=449 RepID=A0A0A8UKM7_LEGHA|nr:protein of unknown function [Legionella hackeliae]